MFKKVLVVEDSPDTREILALTLTAEGYEVITAEDGREGLKMTDAERPDLIITDINMPNLNGIEMIRMIRGKAEFARVPIVAITAYGSGPANEALNVGANKAMAKPLDFASLAGKIRQMLS